MDSKQGVPVPVMTTVIHHNYIVQIGEPENPDDNKQIQIMLPALGQLIVLPEVTREDGERLAKELTGSQVVKGTLLDMPPGVRG